MIFSPEKRVNESLYNSLKYSWIGIWEHGVIPHKESETLDDAELPQGYIWGCYQHDEIRRSVQHEASDRQKHIVAEATLVIQRYSTMLK